MSVGVAPEDAFSSRLATLTREAWSTATSTADQLASQLGISTATSALERRVRPKIEQGAAAWRWSSFGQSTVVPLPSSWDEPRTLIALLNLGRVVYDELGTQRLHNTSSTTAWPTSSSEDDQRTPPPQFPLPPVTSLLAAAAVWRFLTPGLVRQVCLSPYCVIERREPLRLLTSCLVHLDAPHLLTNLAALLPEAAAMERSEGPALFAADVALLAVASSGLFVGWAVLEKEVLQRPDTYYAVGAVGLSSLAFALQVVHGESLRGSSVTLLGLPLPAQYGWVVQLGITHLLAPDSSFAGHLAGVLAGIAHTYLLRPALRALLGRRDNARLRGPQPRFYGSGTLSGRPVSGRGAGAGGGTRRSIFNALSQLGLAAATVVIYVLASQRRSKQPLSNWSLR